MFDSVFSIGSMLSFAITISVGAIISIRALKINATINNKSHTVNGVGNTFINNEYNEVMKDAQNEFKYLRAFIAVVIILALPSFSGEVNYFLYSFSFVATLFSLIGVVFIMVTRGAIKRVWDLFYVVATLVNSVFAYYTARNVVRFLSTFDGYYERLLNALLIVPNALKDIRNLPYYMRYVNEQISGLLIVVGFVLVFTSLIYMTFAYVKQRSFSGAIAFSVSNSFICLIGYLLASNVVWAYFSQDYEYLSYVFEPIKFISSYFFNFGGVVP